jgi:hypothetical protein
MALTYKSTIQEYVQIIIRDSDGSTRVATLERNLDNPRNWNGSIEHPSGEKWTADSFSPDSAAAIGDLAQMFVSRESDYRQAKARNHHRTPERAPLTRAVVVSENMVPTYSIPRR